MAVPGRPGRVDTLCLFEGSVRGEFFVSFTVERPFFLAIRDDRTKTVLLMGVVMDSM